MAGNENAGKNNPNVGVLGDAEYQSRSERIKGFCPRVVVSAVDYEHYIIDRVLPTYEKSGASRIIDRAIVGGGLDLNGMLAPYSMVVEARVKLGGRWEGYDWIMSGRNATGRKLTPETLRQLHDLSANASQFKFEPTRPLLDGFKLESIEGKNLSEGEIRDLSEIFRNAFLEYITPITEHDFLRDWTADASCMPHVVMSADGRIVSVASAG